MYDGIMAETIRIAGHGGDEIGAYFARPLGPGPYPGVVVIHHMPGWDEATKEIARRFATHGYSAICPNLFYREVPGRQSRRRCCPRPGRPAGCPGRTSSGRRRWQSPFPAVRWSDSNGKVGVIGYCSGGGRPT